MNTIQLSPATSTENLAALEEVKNFSRTDMGRGGPGQWTYRVLTDEQATQELERLAEFETLDNVDSATLQPSQWPDDRSQDRRIIQKWALADGTWTFVAVLDGHAGHDAVDYAAAHLPPMVRESLESTVRGTPLSADAPLAQAVSSLLSGCIMRVDDTLTHDFLALFPGGHAWLSRAPDSAIQAIVDDRNRVGQVQTPGVNWSKGVRCISGATALVVLLDPSGTHLWTANLGDSYAVLGTCDRSTGHCRAKLLHDIHNAHIPEEVARIQREHPGESDTCIENGRVLGFLSPTRALGDTWLKIPKVYTERVFLPMGGASWAARDVVKETLTHHRSPPYISNVPDVRHHNLHEVFPPSPSNAAPVSRGTTERMSAVSNLDSEMVLILASDGLYDLYEDQQKLDSRHEAEILERWVRVASEAWGTSASALSNSANAAIAVIRDGLGGPNVDLVSMNLTVEMDEKWMDDTTVVVIAL